MKFVKIFSYILLLVCFLPVEEFAQQRITNRGSSTFRKVGVHRGNQVRTVFGNWGVIAQPGNEGPRGAWKYDANGYVGDVSPVVGLLLPVRDYTQPPDGIPDTVHSVTITPVDRPGGGEQGSGKSNTFEPIPGFADPLLDEIGKGVAMSHQTETWPPSWPDYPDWIYSTDANGDGIPDPIIVNGEDVTPSVDWNGYFGRGQLNADQESYYWMDDFNDDEFQLRYGYVSDEQNPGRTGQSLQVSVRGLQWSNFLAQDVLFWLYNITNDGTRNYPQAVFGTVIGTYVGVEDPEWIDDASFFDIRESITYTWDFDKFISPSANPQWQPDPRSVGYIAYAFLESPGNDVDGIDNDGDNDETYPNFTAQAEFFASENFDQRTINAGTELILINPSTFERTSFTMPNHDTTVTSMGVQFNLTPGMTLVEGNIDASTNVNINSRDGIDNDLDGLIDENYIVHYRVFKRSGNNILIDQVAPVMYKDHISGIGLNDRMIDEGRDDGIDNDGDWNPEFDDVGADGKEGTGDFGENDGVPTLGEPNFDRTDIDESDQLGLTSFEYFVPAGNITMSNDEDMWKRLTPGFFEVPASITNNQATRGEDGDFMFGSGYFPLRAGRTERFSLALAFGDNFEAVLKTKQIAQTIYNANYNFPRPPEKPTLTAVPGDGKVTLYWDKIAESSVDPTLRINDFEGYKIYKGTDPDLTDALLITNYSGEKVFYRPIAQYDLINGIRDIFIPSPTLANLTGGVPFNLGTDNGIQNFFVDNDVINGRTYYYAVVAYDRGDASKDIFPSENTRFISKDALGRISTDLNTVAVVPNAPVLGYVPPPTGIELTRESGNSTAVPFFEVIDPFKVRDAVYEVQFVDSTINGVDIAYEYNVIRHDDGQPVTVLSGGQLNPDNADVVDGIRLSIDTSYQSIDSIKYNNQKSGWNNKDTKNLLPLVSQFTSSVVNGIRAPNDYAIVFSDSYTDSSNHLSNLFGSGAPPAKQVNFRIYDVTDPVNPERIQFIFTEGSAYRRDTLSFLDQITLSNAEGTEVTWKIILAGDSSSNVPKGGDTLFVSLYKPFDSNDNFTFTTKRAAYDVNNVRDQLDKIKVVPNPYVISNVFEQPLPPQVRGRGERVINFTNLPPGARIHIYTASGTHIRTLEHNGEIGVGSTTWDVRTKEGLDVAYGVYFYVVEIDGISDKKMGKLAIIK
jgi:hypothetical protein